MAHSDECVLVDRAVLVLVLVLVLMRAATEKAAVVTVLQSVLSLLAHNTSQPLAGKNRTE